MTNAKLKSQEYAVAASGAYEKGSFTAGLKSKSMHTNMFSCSCSTHIKCYNSQNPHNSLKKRIPQKSMTNGKKSIWFHSKNLTNFSYNYAEI